MNPLGVNTEKSKANASSGFSILELLIAISIFVGLTSILLVSQTGLNSRVNVDTLAHNIGQWMRDAQISAMSVRRATDGTFPPGYGLHFSTAQNGQFIYFRDLDPDGTGPGLPNKLYNIGTGVCGSATTECEQTIQLLQGYTVYALCGIVGGGACTPTTELDVAFARPEPDAYLAGSGGLSYSSARITITSPKDLRRDIVIYVTGQVSIQQSL